MDASDTKTRLLDAAERLFAERGIDSTSLRMITAEAGANLASIHYHFGSKEALIREVFTRRVQGMNEARLQRLDALETSSGRKAPAVEAIIEAFIAPVLAVHMKIKNCDRPFVQLLARIYSEPEDIQRLVFDQFEGVAARFMRALQRALPKVPEYEIAWRFKFMIGAMAMSVMSYIGLEHCLGVRPANGEMKSVVEQLIPFLAAGFKAPATGAAK